MKKEDSKAMKMESERISIQDDDENVIKVEEKVLEKERQFETSPKQEKHEGLFKCETCSKSFLRPNLLSRHEKRIHSGNRSFSCKTCQKCFASSTYLKRHQESHEVSLES